MDGEKDKQRRFSVWDKAAASPQSSVKNSYIICSVQLDSYPLQVDSATEWIHESERITLTTHQYTESLEVIDGAGQNHRGVPKVSLKIGVRGAVGQQQLQGAQIKKKKVNSELHPDSVLSSPTHTPVSFTLHRTAAVSVCGQQPNVAGMTVQGLFRADGWVRFCQICKQLSVTLERSGCSKRQVHVLQEMWYDDMTVNDPFPSFCLNVLRSIVCLFNSIHSFFISFYFFNCLFFYLAYLHIFLFLFILYFYVIFSSFLLSIFLFCIFFYLFFTYCIFLLHIFLLNKKLAIFLLMRKTRLNKLFYNGLPVCVMALSERLNLRGHWNLLWWEWELNLILFHQKEIKSNVSYWPIEKIKPAIPPLQIS